MEQELYIIRNHLNAQHRIAYKMNRQTPTPDLDRIAIITASATAFIFVVSWILYGTMKLTGETSDWRPMCHGHIATAIDSTFCRNILCRRRTLYEAGSDSEPEDEDGAQETHGPENEEKLGTKFE